MSRLKKEFEVESSYNKVIIEIIKETNWRNEKEMEIWN